MPYITVTPVRQKCSQIQKFSGGRGWQRTSGKKQRECIPCRNVGKNLKTQIPKTDKSEIKTNEPGQELQLDFTGELISDKLQSRPKNLVAVDHFSKWTTAKICQNTETKTVTKFLEQHFNLHGVPKKIRTDNDTAFTSKEFKDFCNQYKIERITGLLVYAHGNRIGRTDHTITKKFNSYKPGR